MNMRVFVRLYIPLVFSSIEGAGGEKSSLVIPSEGSGDTNEREEFDEAVCNTRLDGVGVPFVKAGGGGYAEMRPSDNT
jgi:hypothetical protein